MNDIIKTQELAARTLGLWADAQQQFLRTFVDVGSVMAKDGVRLYGELQRTAIDAVSQGQAAALRWQALAKDALADPSIWYEKSVSAGVSDTEQAFRLAEEHVQSLARAAERVQATAERAAKDIQEAVTGTAAKLKEIYATN